MPEVVYLLVRKNPDTGKLERIRFDSGILTKMRVTPDEWKPLMNLEDDLA